MGRGEKKIFTAEETTDEDGSEESITLPMDLAMLKSLTMRFVDNPDFEEDPDDQGRMKASGQVATDTSRRKQMSGAKLAEYKKQAKELWSDSCTAPRSK